MHCEPVEIAIENRWGVAPGTVLTGERGLEEIERSDAALEAAIAAWDALKKALGIETGEPAGETTDWGDTADGKTYRIRIESIGGWIVAEAELVDC